MSRFGVPLEVVHDRGSQFESDLFHALSEKLGFIKLRTCSYNLRCNGMIERQHRTLKSILRCRKEQWIEALPFALFAMRAMPSSATDTSPFMMVTGSELLVPNLCLNPRAAAKDPHEFVSCKYGACFFQSS